MDIEKFVQDLKFRLDSMGISYARAGRESGAGSEFIRNMERKKTAPSIEKVVLMADYLGVSTSELLGEVEPALDEKRLAPTKESEPLDDELIRLWSSLPAADAEKVKAFVQGLIAAREEPPSDAE